MNPEYENGTGARFFQHRLPAMLIVGHYRLAVTYTAIALLPIVLALSMGDARAGVGQNGGHDQGSSYRGQMRDGSVEPRSSMPGPLPPTMLAALAAGNGIDDREDPGHASRVLGKRWITDMCGPGRTCPTVVFRVASAVADSLSNTMKDQYASNADVWLYHVQFKVGTGAWQSMCTTTDGGMQVPMGVVVRGQWGPDGAYKANGHSFSCIDGVIAKCVRQWGYKPWKSLPGKRGIPVSLRPLHRSCVRATRADYCGNGVSYTRDGTFIDIADEHGFNDHETERTTLRDEAAFDENGARWVHTPRLGGGVLRDGRWRFRCCSVTASPGRSDGSVLRVRS